MRSSQWKEQGSGVRERVRTRTGDLVVLLVFLIVAIVISQLVGRAQASLAAATFLKFAGDTDVCLFI